MVDLTIAMITSRQSQGVDYIYVPHDTLNKYKSNQIKYVFQGYYGSVDCGWEFFTRIIRR